MPCRKFRHPTREMAESHIAALIAKGNECPRRTATLEVYWCRWCQVFHVGHYRTPAQLARVRARTSVSSPRRPIP